MGQTPRHIDQAALDKLNKSWYKKGWFNGFAIGVSVAAIIAFILVMVLF